MQANVMWGVAPHPTLCLIASRGCMYIGGCTFDDVCTSLLPSASPCSTPSSKLWPTSSLWRRRYTSATATVKAGGARREAFTPPYFSAREAKQGWAAPGRAGLRHSARTRAGRRPLLTSGHLPPCARTAGRSPLTLIAVLVRIFQTRTVIVSGLRPRTCTLQAL